MTAPAIPHAAADRRGLRGGRHRVQVRRRAVPHVAAGRLPRRADRDHAVHRLGAEAGRLRHGLPAAGGRAGPLDEQWRLLAWLAVASLAIGNLVAIAQTNLKRMLAYSTISHVGFLFLGLARAGPAGVRGGDVLRDRYALMSAAAFGAIVPAVAPRLRGRGDRRLSRPERARPVDRRAGAAA
jgi:hypothetical protein